MSTDITHNELKSNFDTALKAMLSTRPLKRKGKKEPNKTFVSWIKFFDNGGKKGDL
jgi:hypothetical protein